MSDARKAFERIAEDLDLRQEFPDEVRAEVAKHLASPGIDDPSLADLLDLPFVTIDGASSRDLDQALHVERAPDGHRVRYAIADAAYYIRPGTALFEEALRRGASYYLPGFSVPMLPRELSEGLVSLNPDVERRALVFDSRLDERGVRRETSLYRARIRSRAKLAFGDVQRFYDAPAAHLPSAKAIERSETDEHSETGERGLRESARTRSPLALDMAARESLLELREVGELRMARANEADLVRYRRRNVEVDASGDRLGFVVLEAVRDRVELYNEQLSLLCNQEAGRLLAERASEHLQPIYRVHPAPDPDRVSAFVEMTARFSNLHGVPALAMERGEHLGDYLGRVERLEQGASSDDRARLGRVVRAVERQALLLNVRSAFAGAVAPHHGVGAEAYARASSPMREIVGVFLHKELVEMIGGAPGGDAADLDLRERVVAAGNDAKSMQKRVDDHVNRYVIDRIFEGDLAASAPPRRGTVMGITGSRVHVELDDPGLDVKVYLPDLGRSLGGAWLDVDEGGVALRRRDDGSIVCRLGDSVAVTIEGRDDRRDRWRLSIVAL